ncbi:NADH-quinone oxidoreductase subunit C [Streptomyces sp. DSM 116496]|uniref:NADH-quinone oxidoreductase subunit C n=1 Tax=Streptomyces stoeckheimensis TaxID=3344656 RepID=UPI0038B3D257
MNLYDSLPDAAGTIFGAEAVGSLAYSVLTVDVPTASWIPALEIARDKLGCTYFDWLSAVDEPGTGFRICAHVVSLENHRVRRLLLRTTVPHSAPSLPSAVSIYAGAEWHERETWEMFGVSFTDHPNLVPLLLPENFEGHPLRKDFVLAARVAKAWPGAKEPGEAHDPDAPKRRQMLPPGVPDPNDWGPMKGQLPPAPTRPARTPRAAAGAAAGAAGDRPARTPRAAGDRLARTPREATPTSPDETPARPVRRTRSVADGSASQAQAPAAATTPDPAEAEAVATQAETSPTPTEAAPGRPARRSRSVTDGSASQAEASAAGAAPAPPEASATDAEAAPARPVRRSRSVADGSASQTAASSEAEGTPAVEPQAPARTVRGSADAPWHNPKPAFDTPTSEPAEPAEPVDHAASAAPATPAAPADGPAGSAEPESEQEPGSAPKPDPSETDPTPNDPTGGAA